MTDRGGISRRPSTRHPKSVHLLRLLPVAAFLAVAAPVAISTTAGATGSLATEQAKADQIEAEIQQTGRQIDALDQRYEAALEKKAALDAKIKETQAQIDRSFGRIAADKLVLHKAAIEAYVTGGTSAATDVLFSTSQTTAMDSSVYNEVITGNLDTSVADLHTAIAQLDAQRQTLRREDAQAAQAVATAHDAYLKAQTLEMQENGALTQVKGEIATLISQQQAAAEAAARTAAQAEIAAAPKTTTPARTTSPSTTTTPSTTTSPSTPATPPTTTTPSTTTTTTTTTTPTPPAASVTPPAQSAPPPVGGGGGEAAVQAAETQLGVPYVWGGEDPGVGFDCSGLTAWAWGQAGVSLPHYSGAQMADSTPVSISDLQPGDLLFYGPGGSVHVAMYVGGGMMIEATFPGTVVRIDPVRFGTTFAGAGQP